MSARIRFMAIKPQRAHRRTEALSRDVIVEAATEILDAEGEDALTLRALTVRLTTGYGAIYHHVADRDELLAAAADRVIARIVADLAADAEPGQALRAVALGLFDAIDAHPWLGTQLALQMSRSPWQSATPQILERIGRQVRALGVPEGSQFTTIFALVYYILGAAGQNAVNRASAGMLRPGVARNEYLDAVVTQWEALDPEEYPFIRAAAGQLREHDDRSEFLAGVDVILAGITSVYL